MTFHKEPLPGLGNGSRLATVLPFPGNDPVRAITVSVGVKNAQTRATDANEVLPTLEQPLSPRGEATSTTIDTSQRVSSAFSPHDVQMEIQDTPIYLDTREITQLTMKLIYLMPLSLLLTLQLQTICKIIHHPLLTVRYIFLSKLYTSS